MAPSILEEEQSVPISFEKTYRNAPLKPTGLLDVYDSFDVTPILGTEFPQVDLAEWLRAPNSDELIRELAIKISTRNVVFFRSQNNLTNDLQKELVQRLGAQAGKPSTSTLHIHPILNASRPDAPSDPELSLISSKLNKQVYKNSEYDMDPRRQKTAQWHSDIAFEPFPSDYTCLRLTQLPQSANGRSVGSGGDTLFASGYEIYDKISPPYRRFLETLTATFAQPYFESVGRNENFPLHAGPRGHPENVGATLRATHPVVRTNPVTGWKSVFPIGGHTQKVDGLSEQESAHLLGWWLDLIYHNPELQCRHRWEGPNDLAIWDNRSTFHSATFDYQGKGDRAGVRVVGIGERPYFDVNSVSRREGIAAAEGTQED